MLADFKMIKCMKLLMQTFLALWRLHSVNKLTN